MAQEVILKVDKDSLTKVTAEHTVDTAPYNTYGTETRAYVSLLDTSEEETKTVTSEFLVPMDFPKSCIIKSLQIPTRQSATSSTDGSVCTLVVDGTEYTLNQDGTAVNDLQLTDHLNSYKELHGAFPEVGFKIVSTITKPSSEDGTNTVNVYFSNPICICGIDGGSVICRPSADVTVGHDIPDGFTGVYQLVNEEVADDDTTYIESYSEGDGEITEKDDRHTVVVLDLELPDKAKVRQIRPAYCIKMYEGSVANSGSARTGITVSCGESTNTLTTDALYYSEGITDKYETLEGVWNEGCDLVDTINAIDGKKTLQMALNTYAKGNYNSAKGGIDAYARITQAYMEVVYEYADETEGGLYMKANGGWKRVKSLRKKEDGAWAEITEEECESILKSSSIILTGQRSEP